MRGRAEPAAIADIALMTRTAISFLVAKRYSVRILMLALGASIWRLRIWASSGGKCAKASGTGQLEYATYRRVRWFEPCACASSTAWLILATVDMLLRGLDFVAVTRSDLEETRPVQAQERAKRRD